jgi:2-methylcitrate dehydratase PrpD
MTASDSAGLSLQLAQYATQVSFASLPASTVHATKRALLDAIGVISAASGIAPEARPFIDLAVASGGKASSRILGTGILCPPAAAALANGALSHALDYEDAYDGAPVHPNASLIPAVLALAQARAPVSGRDLIAAIAVGCDLACRMGLSLRQPLEQGGWYPPPILGAVGAVAGAARLLRLSPRQLVDAWSLLLLQNSCSGEIIHSPGSTIRAVREAFPAQAAVNCVLLAEAGIQGFSAPLEGTAGFFRMFAGGNYSVQELLSDLGARWYVDSLSFKPWPSCRGTHAAIEAALVLRSRPSFDCGQVERIIIEGGSVQAMLAEPLARKSAPATAIEAKFSLPFTVALALGRGEVTLDSFDAGSREDPALRAIAGRCIWRQRLDWGRERATSGALQIHLRNGVQLRHEVQDALGCPTRPLDDAHLLLKFEACLSRASRPLSTAQSRALATRVLALENEPDAGAIFA